MNEPFNEDFEQAKDELKELRKEVNNYFDDLEADAKVRAESKEITMKLICDFEQFIEKMKDLYRKL